VSVNELIQRNGNTGGYVQVFVRQLFSDRIGLRIGRIEKVEDLYLLGRDLLFGDGALRFQKLVGFGLNDMAAEGRRQRGLVRLHIQHVLDRMAEMTDPGAL